MTTIITISADGKIHRFQYEDKPRNLTLAHCVLLASIAIMTGVFIWATIGDQISERIEAQLYEDKV